MNASTLSLLYVSLKRDRQLGGNECIEVTVTSSRWCASHAASDFAILSSMNDVIDSVSSLKKVSLKPDCGLLVRSVSTIAFLLVPRAIIHHDTHYR